LVPNPYNVNYYMNNRSWHSARLITRAINNRYEKSFKNRFIFELFDIFYDKSSSASIKKKNELIDIIKENKLNMRYLRKKRKN
jgi:ribosomal protein S7